MFSMTMNQNFALARTVCIKNVPDLKAVCSEYPVTESHRPENYRSEGRICMVLILFTE